MTLRLARLHGDPGEAQPDRRAGRPVLIERRPVLGEHGERVEGPGGHPARGHNEVRARGRRGEGPGQGRRRVRAARHGGEGGPVLDDEPGQQHGVGVGDRAGRQCGAGVDQLGAGGDDGDPGARHRPHRARPRRGQGGQGRGAQDGARAQHRVADAHVLPGAAHIEPGAGRDADLDPFGQGAGAGLLVGVLDPDDGVGPLGQHGAGHDPLGGARLQGRGDRPGGHVAVHRQDDGGRASPGGVGCAHRVAVHGRVRPRGYGQGGGRVFGQDEAVRLGQREHDGGQRLQGGEEFGDIGLGRLHGAHYEALPPTAGRCRRAGGARAAAFPEAFVPGREGRPGDLSDHHTERILRAWSEGTAGSPPVRPPSSRPSGTAKPRRAGGLRGDRGCSPRPLDV